MFTNYITQVHKNPNSEKTMNIHENVKKAMKNSDLKHSATLGSRKYQKYADICYSSGSQISVNMRANNPREKQKVTSGYKECGQQKISPGVHPKKNCFFQKPSGASISVLGGCWCRERKFRLQRKDSYKNF